MISLTSVAARPPTWRTGPLAKGESQGVEAADLAELAGLALDEWQRDVLLHALALDGDRWSAFEVAVLVPRQNGKGAILEALELHALYRVPECRLILHSAHEFKTAKEAFRRIVALIDSNPKLRKRARVRYTTGEEGIELDDGSRLKFVARSSGSGRGFSGDLVILDEAYNLSDDMMSALLPTMAARPNPQLWYTSSAPLPRIESEVLRRLCKRGRAGTSERLAYFEWGMTEGDDPLSVETWARANPAFPYRIDEEFVIREHEALGEDGFLRERLGFWREEGEYGVVPYDIWTGLVDLRSAPAASGVSYGLASAPDGSAAAVGSSGRRSDGLLHVDTVRWSSGTDWVVPYVIDLHSRKRRPIRVNPAGAEGAFIRPLVEAGVEVVEVDGRGYQAACGEFLDAVKNRQLRHLGQRTLDTSVSVAGRRDVGKEGGWVWVRLGETDITPLVAATVALSGVKQRRVPTIW